MIFIIVCLVVVVSLAVILISELWYMKQKKDSDKAYLEDLRIQSMYIDEDEWEKENGR
jgi:flagellar basal body-associated protein FliL|tara:strand:- start:86 stop:259 length:174 start_codon:yes stop_codon:yes gene_type:complete